MIRGKRDRKRREKPRSMRRVWYAQIAGGIIVIAEDQINQERKESSVDSGGRVIMSDSLSTHLDPKSVVAKFAKSADEREVEGRMEFYRRNICTQSGVVSMAWRTDKDKRGTVEVIESDGDVLGGKRETGRRESEGGRVERVAVGSRVEFARMSICAC